MTAIGKLISRSFLLLAVTLAIGSAVLEAQSRTDGSVKQLEAVSGPDVLIPSSKAAVGQWRYRPVLLNGEPVEVDTTIDVIYSLNY